MVTLIGHHRHIRCWVQLVHDILKQFTHNLTMRCEVVLLLSLMLSVGEAVGSSGCQLYCRDFWYIYLINMTMITSKWVILLPLPWQHQSYAVLHIRCPFLSIIIKSPRYTGGDFMFLYRFVRRRRRRRCRPQILVHAITFEELFGFFSFLAQLLALTCRLPD